MNTDFLDFNKQIFFGELGSLLGAPLFGVLCSRLNNSPTAIATWSVLGSLAGAAVFWLAVRIIDEKRKKRLSVKNIAETIAWYTPIAFILAIFLYQPVLFFLSKHFLEQSGLVIVSIIGAQALAFLSFLIVINAYRIIINRYTGKKL
ncbi:hypothetical protein C4573_04365 [Candidatus Woesearchaeota archaeon]|nr:MAG: hypothetical protein C4573_04365 [Candidatus Woesearchaeota archaeon]